MGSRSGRDQGRRMGHGRGRSRSREGLRYWVNVGGGSRSGRGSRSGEVVKVGGGVRGQSSLEGGGWR